MDKSRKKTQAKKPKKFSLTPLSSQAKNESEPSLETGHSVSIDELIGEEDVASLSTSKRSKNKKRPPPVMDPTFSKGWKRTKINDDITFDQAGFYMLEEFTFDEKPSESEFNMITRSIPLEPSTLEYEPKVDTTDEDLLNGEPLTAQQKAEEAKKAARVSNTSTVSKPAFKSKRLAEEVAKRTVSSKPTNNNEQDKKDESENLESSSTTSTSKTFTSNSNNNSNGDNNNTSDDNNGEIDQNNEWTKIYPLHPTLIQALLQHGYTTPTPIQEAVMKPALMGTRKDVVGASPTGSGKTLAFGLPILHQLLEMEDTLGHEHSIKALILSPTRELSMQIVEHLQKLTQNTNIGVEAIVGGILMEKQIRRLKKRADIIVATPGRLWELINTGELSDLGLTLAHLRFLVFDEADKMIDFGRFAELSNILRNVYETRRRANENEENFDDEETSSHKPSNTVKPIQTFMFSATISVGAAARLNLTKIRKKKFTDDKRIGMGVSLNQEEVFAKFMEQIDFQREISLVDLTNESHRVEGLVEAKIFCMRDEKDFYLYYFLTQFPGKTLVFVNAISNIKRLQPLLTWLRVPAYAMHAQMEQHHRLKNLDKFKSESAQAVLIATEVMARGLDVQGIDHVIHYSIPVNTESFIHRSGRTARAFSSGLSLSIVDPEDRTHYTKILTMIQREEPPDFPIAPVILSMVKKRVTIAQKLNNFSRQTQRAKSSVNWVKRMAMELDAEIPDDLLEDDKDMTRLTDDASIKSAAYQRAIEQKEYAALKAELKELLDRPISSKSSYLTRAFGAKLMGIEGSSSLSQISHQILTSQSSTTASDTPENIEGEQPTTSEDNITAEVQEDTKSSTKGKKPTKKNIPSKAPQQQQKQQQPPKIIPRVSSNAALLAAVAARSSTQAHKSVELIDKWNEKRREKHAKKGPLVGPKKKLNL